MKYTPRGREINLICSFTKHLSCGNCVPRCDKSWENDSEQKWHDIHHALSEGPFSSQEERQFTKQSQATMQALWWLLQDSTRPGWRVSAGYRLGMGRREETGKEAKDKPCKLNYEMHRMRYHPDNKNGAEVLYAPLWENVCATLLMGKERSKSTHTASPWNELGPICFKIQ